MRAMNESRYALKLAMKGLQSAFESGEPDEMAAAIAEAGNGIARAIECMDGTFKGFRRDVEANARRLAARGASHA